MYGLRKKLLDCRSPLDWSNSLNRGLVVEWAAVPLSGWSGANKFRALSRGGRAPNDGTFSGGVTWKGNSRAGGYGALNFNGTTGYVDSASAAVTAEPYTVACWAKTSDTTHNQTVCWLGTVNVSTSVVRINVTSGGVWRLNVVDSGGSQTNVVGPSVSSATWTHLAFTKGIAPTGWEFFVNGTSQGTLGSSTMSNFATFSLGVLHNNGGDLQFWNGLLDGAVVWNRALAAVEIRALVAESKAGNPNRWRWLKVAAAFAPAVTAAGLFGPANLSTGAGGPFFPAPY